MEKDDNPVWVHCPNCRRKTRVKVTYKTALINFPLYCPRCRKEYLVDIFHLKMIVHTVPNNKENTAAKETGSIYPHTS